MLPEIIPDPQNQQFARTMEPLTRAQSKLIQALNYHKKRGVRVVIIVFDESGMTLWPGGKAERLGAE